MSEPVQNPDAGEARERNSRETQPQEPADARDTAETQDTAEAQPSGTVNRYQSLALLGSSVLAAASPSVESAAETLVSALSVLLGSSV